jgi:Toprim-like
MLTAVQDAVNLLLPAKRKTNSTSGWTSFNAPCCGDKRGRGGIISNGNGSVSYHCFNCNFKANYTPGRHLNYKFRKLLGYLGADDNTIKRLVIEAVRVREIVAPEELEKSAAVEVTFKPRPLPAEAQTLVALNTFYELKNDNTQVPREFHDAVIYAANRRLDLVKYAFYWTPETQYNLHRRLIIPCTWNNEVIGYTARGVDPKVSPKYYSQYDTNYVFNLDKQHTDAKIVIVVEGPIDAMSIDGVAIMGNECSETQADIIDSLGREVIVVPDADSSGMRLVDSAIEYGWSVSFPEWLGTFKDVNEAVIKHGKLYVLKSIIDARQSNKLKIELKRKLLNI